MLSYEQLTNEIKAAGGICEVSEYGPDEQILVIRNQYDTRDKFCSFWVLERSGCWFACIPGPEIFQISNQSSVVSFCVQLCTRLAGRDISEWVSPSLISKHGVTKISSFEWSMINSALIQAKQAVLGWEEIPDDISDKLFDTICNSFNHEEEWFGEPPNSISITWDIHSALEKPESELTEIEEDLNRKCISAFRACIEDKERVLGIHWQSTFYYLNVFNNSLCEAIKLWPIRLLPISDNFYLMTEDFSLGLLGDVKGTITVFGETMLEYFSSNLPNAFGEIVRRNGELVDTPDS